MKLVTEVLKTSLCDEGVHYEPCPGERCCSTCSGQKERECVSTKDLNKKCTSKYMVFCTECIRDELGKDVLLCRPALDLEYKRGNEPKNADCILFIGRRNTREKQTTSREVQKTIVVEVKSSVSNMREALKKNIAVVFSVLQSGILGRRKRLKEIIQKDISAIINDLGRIIGKQDLPQKLKKEMLLVLERNGYVMLEGKLSGILKKECWSLSEGEIEKIISYLRAYYQLKGTQLSEEELGNTISFFSAYFQIESTINWLSDKLFGGRYETYVGGVSSYVFIPKDQYYKTNYGEFYEENQQDPIIESIKRFQKRYKVYPRRTVEELFAHQCKIHSENNSAEERKCWEEIQ